jgi:ubiquinol-cytochrome c reductase cytochrome b subunit
VKDFLGFSVFFMVFAWFILFSPNSLGHPDNYIPANPMVTPAHIVPEWYFLPFYAILRAVPDKLMGVLAMFASILILFILPWLDHSKVRSATFRPMYKMAFWVFLFDCLLLGYAGGQTADWGVLLAFDSSWLPDVTVPRIAAFYYFLHFLVIVPYIACKEKPLPLPASIANPVVKTPAKA